MKDFYLVLQVTRRATPEEIRSAYRRRALELHPDRSGSGSEPFIELQEAYSVLSDPSQRAAYDRQAEAVPIRRSGDEVFRRQPAEPFREVEPISRFRDISLTKSFASFAPSFDELFDRLWSNFDLLTRPKAETLNSLTIEVPLSEAEALVGGSLRISVPARLRCQRCDGRGDIGPFECWQCRGQGALTVEYPVEVSYPAGLRHDYVLQVPLEQFGIGNFYLTVRFRPTSVSFD